MPIYQQLSNKAVLLRRQRVVQVLAVYLLVAPPDARLLRRGPRPSFLSIYPYS